ncbi:MAG TPA: SRPBCC domain-containing protein [Gemmatimonadota bacterium]|nr:SRPBCC domain-containing protein [Gemmatimonadota bacterium]
MSRAEADTRSLVLERQLPHPPEKIWRALTENSLLEQWFMQNDFLPVVGHRFQFRAEPRPHWNGVTDSEVLEVAPNERLAYTWDASGEEAAGGLKTVVTWTLTPTSEGTQVRMEHSGFRPEEDTRNLEGARFGWPRFLEGLERVVADLDTEPRAR